MILDRVSEQAVGVFKEVEPVRERDGAYQLKVTLMEVAPPVWRRLQVPSVLTLDRLHRVLAGAMGWTAAHRHEFVIGDRRYGTPEPESSGQILREHGVTLRDVVSGENMRFVYRYDMGDRWQHEVVVEKILVTHAGLAMPVCLAGERHCPPEDCGGVEGYEEFLEAIRRRHHPLHHAMLGWAGGRFDPDTFNLDEVNRELGWLREHPGPVHGQERHVEPDDEEPEVPAAEDDDRPVYPSGRTVEVGLGHSDSVVHA